MKLNNESVTIELKNGSVVHGTITGAGFSIASLVFNTHYSLKLPSLSRRGHANEYPLKNS